MVGRWAWFLAVCWLAGAGSGAAQEVPLDTSFGPPAASPEELREAERWSGTPIVAVTASPPILAGWELRRLLEFKLGEVITYEQAQRAVRNLLATDRFAFVDVRRAPAEGGDTLVFELEPQPFVKQIRLRGNAQASKRKVQRWLPFRYYDRLDPGLIELTRETLGDRYEQAGYPRPRIEISTKTLDDRGARQIQIEFHETPLPRLQGGIELEGLPSDLRLHERIWIGWQNRRDHLFGASDCNEVELKKHVERAVNSLRGMGYFEATGRLDLQAGPPPRARVVLDPGRRVELRVTGGNGGARDAVFQRFWKVPPTKLDERSLLVLSKKLEQALAELGWHQPRLEASLEQAGGRWRLTLNISEGVPTTVRQISFSGNEALKPDELATAMLTAPKSWIPGSSAPFLATTLDADLKAISGLYSLHGYPSAVAKSSVDIDAQGGTSIQIQIEEGRRLTVGQFKIQGSHEFSERQLIELVSGVGLRPGEPLSQALLGLAAQSIALRYAQAGYPKARLKISRAGRAEAAVDLVIEIDEGQRQTQGKLIPAGNYKTSTRMLLRSFKWREGQPLDPTRLSRLQERQIDLGVLDSVLLEPRQDEAGRTDVLIHVQERQAGTMDLSVLLDSAAGAGLEGRLAHENLWGRGLGASFEASAQASGVSWASVQKLRAAAALSRPTLAGRIFPITLSALYLKDKTNADFEERTLSTELAFARSIFKKRLQLSTSLGLEDLQIELKGDNSNENLPEPGRVFFLAPRALYDSRNDFSNPTRGVLASVQVRSANSILFGQEDFFKLETDVRTYLTFDRTLTLALALRTGFALAYGASSTVPATDRFFLGGDSTHRAFAFGELSPRNESGTLIGGNSFVLGNVELRFPLFGQLNGGLFLDLGDAWGNGEGFSLRPGLGAGLRYLTLIGPLRLDFGWNPKPKTYHSPTTEQPDRVLTENNFQIHVALGHSF